MNMKIYDCGGCGCYITSWLADWEVLAMLQGEGWAIDKVTEVTEAEYRLGTTEPEQTEEKEICPHCNGTNISPYEHDGGSCPHLFWRICKMISQKKNGSLRGLFLAGGRLDILLWAHREMDRQQVAAADERQAIRFGKGLELVKECPCGCGLQGDVCPARAATIKRLGDEIPF
jgi:hypothetical protein